MYDEDVESDIRTASYVSNTSIDAEDYESLRKRQLKTISKLHAKEIIAQKLNRKVAEASVTAQL